MRFLCTIILSTVFIFVGQAQKTKLALNLDSGKTYTQSTEAKATVEQDVYGEKMKIVMNIKGDMSYLVTSIEGDSYHMEVRYESLSIDMEMPQGKNSFSSEKDDETDIFSTILKEMTGHPFQITMTNTGKITEVKNAESLFDAAFDKFPNIPEAQLNQLKTQINQAYGAKAFKGNIEMATSIFPDKPVKKGESWTIETQLESGMAADMTTNYTYVESDKSHHVIRGESVIKTADKDAYIEANGMPMRYDITGSMNSEIKVDKKTGWIIEANINQEMSGDAHIKENPQLPDGLTIPMVLTTKTKIFNNK